MTSTPSMPARESSSVLVTCDSTTSVDAPARRVLTVTTGSSILGYSRTVSRLNETQADQHHQQGHHGREDRTPNGGFRELHAAVPCGRRPCGLKAAPVGASAGRATRPVHPPGRPARGPAVGGGLGDVDHPYGQAVAAQQPVWPAVARTSPALWPSRISTRPGRRSPIFASSRCEASAPRRPSTTLKTTAGAQRHQRFLRHDHGAFALRRRPPAAARTCPA